MAVVVPHVPYARPYPKAHMDLALPVKTSMDAIELITFGEN